MMIREIAHRSVAARMVGSSNKPGSVHNPYDGVIYQNKLFVADSKISATNYSGKSLKSYGNIVARFSFAAIGSPPGEMENTCSGDCGDPQLDRLDISLGEATPPV